MYNNVMYQIASNVNNKISIPPVAVGARTYAMDMEIYSTYTHNMYACAGMVPRCKSLRSAAR